MASPPQWTWVWASSRRWWRTRKPGMLQSLGLQRHGHDWVTEQQQQLSCILKNGYAGTFHVIYFSQWKNKRVWQIYCHLDKNNFSVILNISYFPKKCVPNLIWLTPLEVQILQRVAEWCWLQSLCLLATRQMAQEWWISVVPMPVSCGFYAGFVVNLRTLLSFLWANPKFVKEMRKCVRNINSVLHKMSIKMCRIKDQEQKMC